MAEPMGPFSVRHEAASHPAVNAIYVAARESGVRGTLAEGCYRMLTDACQAAGVELGAYDQRILRWLSDFGPEECAVLAGIISRAGKRPPAEHAALLGKRVRVTLDKPEGEPAVITEGILLRFGDCGEFVIRQDDGFAHYCWPMLDIEEAPGA